MDEQKDIRWKQRFQNYRKALMQLEKAAKLAHERELSDIEEQGLIKSFEFTFELAWLVIKDFFEFQGETSITGSRDAFRIAFKRSLISDGELWMTMIESRKKSVHTYNEEMAEVLQKEILHNYMPLFRHLEKNLTEHSEGKQNKLF